ncbi:TVP38/TMEM64 family protein [Ignavigranum ruoffiae]|uniref:TVP38/TMEM64 family protein n=1 Tax=Ignavigranum ruoffiae TaxID=89093 RepID=UPI00204C5FC2|nr:TVP38/TMEM64 family protein [Ignavigranum ruoffiae]UPQ85557.1 TVP38/TMEM64 family protein [Ignavigranum ruoffiae]
MMKEDTMQKQRCFAVNSQAQEEKYLKFFLKHKCMVKWIALAGLILTIGLFTYLIRHNLFNRPEVFERFLRQHKGWGPLVYFFLSFFNTVYPIIPGGLGNVVGYSVFGPFWGFTIAFGANLLGSTVLFLLARKFGKPILFAFFDKETINKYIGYLEKKSLGWFLAIVYVVPGLPDDLFSMLVGLSPMSLARFTQIQLIFKPLTTFLYMAGINNLFSIFSNLLGQS